MPSALLLPALLLFQSVPASQPPAASHLLVLCAVDQLPADYLTRFAEGFGRDGFQRIARDGVTCTAAGYEYAFTETGPGHATIGTGAWPPIRRLAATHPMRGMIESRSATSIIWPSPVFSRW